MFKCKELRKTSIKGILPTNQDNPS